MNEEHWKDVEGSSCDLFKILYQHVTGGTEEQRRKLGTVGVPVPHIHGRVATLRENFGAGV
jgi:hypothetical protein